MKKKLSIDGVELAYTVEGEGLPVILMHGWGCNHTTVASIERVLTAMGLTVYNVDFPGFGESTEPPSVWGVDDYTRLIEKMAQSDGISNPILIGHSFGGRVGILYASRNATRKLILVDAAGIKPRRTLHYYWKVYSYKAYKHLVWAVMGRERGEQLLNRYRSKVGSSDYTQASPRMRAIMSRVVNEDLKHCMPAIKCPTLMIWGENDTATPLADAKTMERLIEGSGLVSFPGCGHYSFLDNPVQFAAVLRSFLDDDAKAGKAQNS